MNMTEEMAMQYQRGYIDGFKEEKATAESFKRITENDLKIIRDYLIDKVFRNEQVMFSNDRNCIDFPEIIASLYEMLHFEVTGETYNYMYHWANKVGSWVEDQLFVEMIHQERSK